MFSSPIGSEAGAAGSELLPSCNQYAVRNGFISRCQKKFKNSRLNTLGLRICPLHCFRITHSRGQVAVLPVFPMVPVLGLVVSFTGSPRLCKLG